MNVEEIIAERSRGLSVSAIAKKHEVSRQTIYTLTKGILPKHSRVNFQRLSDSPIDRCKRRISNLKQARAYFGERIVALLSGEAPIIKGNTPRAELRFYKDAIRACAAKITEKQEELQELVGKASA